LEGHGGEGFGKKREKVEEIDDIKRGRISGVNTKLSSFGELKNCIG